LNSDFGLAALSDEVGTGSGALVMSMVPVPSGGPFQVSASGWSTTGCTVAGVVYAVPFLKRTWQWRWAGGSVHSSCPVWGVQLTDATGMCSLLSVLRMLFWVSR
jgi:hypothetical protein